MLDMKYEIFRAKSMKNCGFICGTASSRATDFDTDKNYEIFV
jgi:hypothetical protein